MSNCCCVNRLNRSVFSVLMVVVCVEFSIEPGFPQRQENLKILKNEDVHGKVLKKSLNIKKNLQKIMKFCDNHDFIKNKKKSLEFTKFVRFLLTIRNLASV